MSFEVITSKDNSSVKRIVKLHNRKKAAEEGLIYLEGIRLCEDALISGSKIVQIVCVESKTDVINSFKEQYSEAISEVPVLVISDSLAGKVFTTVSPQGVAMVIKEPDANGEIPYRDSGKDIYAVLENLQDPGNLGTIIRLSDALDFTAVILIGNTVDPYNEKVIRSSMGSLWHIPIIRKNLDEVCDFFKSKGITSLAMHLKGDLLNDADMKLPAAFFIGNEGNGLSDEAYSKCDKMVKIPMPGKAESFNAASAASIIGYKLFEAGMKNGG